MLVCHRKHRIYKHVLRTLNQSRDVFKLERYKWKSVAVLVLNNLITSGR